MFEGLKKGFKEYELRKWTSQTEYNKSMIKVWQKILDEHDGKHKKARSKSKYHQEMADLYDLKIERLKFDLAKLERGG